MAASIVMCFLTVPAEARSDALEALAGADAVGRFPGTVVSAAASFVRSGGTEIQDSELIVVSAPADEAPTPGLAEDFWRAVESTLFREGVSAVEHMVAYAVPGSA
jgi:hypothetical protein